MRPLVRFLSDHILYRCGSSLALSSGYKKARNLELFMVSGFFLPVAGLGSGGVQFTTEQLAIGANEHWSGLLRKILTVTQTPLTRQKRNCCIGEYERDLTIYW